MKKSVNKNKFHLCLATMGFLLAGCFSPLDYRDDANTTISISLPGGGPAQKNEVQGGELPILKSIDNPNSLRYEIVFTGPGGKTITRNAGYGDTVAIQAAPGLWNIDVTAFGTPSPTGPSGQTTIEAVGEALNVNVKAGKLNNIPIKMAKYMEIDASTWSAFRDEVISDARPYDVFAVVTGGMTAPYTTDTVTIYFNSKTVTIAAKNNATLMLNNPSGNLFDVANGCRLILGSRNPKYNKDVTLMSYNYNSTIHIESGGSFTMNSGTISGNTYMVDGGGVYIEGGGTFTMNGGLISGNGNIHTKGGGVYNSGTFFMNGGEITGNTSSTYFGAGVYNAGAFYMSGGAYIGQDNDVYLGASAEYVMYKITVTGTLTRNPAAIITPTYYDPPGLQVIAGRLDQSPKFQVTPGGIGAPQNYYIDGSGRLQPGP